MNQKAPLVLPTVAAAGIGMILNAVIAHRSGADAALGIKVVLAAGTSFLAAWGLPVWWGNHLCHEQLRWLRKSAAIALMLAGIVCYSLILYQSAVIPRPLLQKAALWMPICHLFTVVAVFGIVVPMAGPPWRMKEMITGLSELALTAAAAWFLPILFTSLAVGYLGPTISGPWQHTALVVTATLLPGFILYSVSSGIGSSVPAEIIAGWYVVCMVYAPIIAEKGMKLLR